MSDVGLYVYSNENSHVLFEKYKFAQGCKSKVDGSVSLRCWPAVLLWSVVARAGNDKKRSSPLISAGVQSSEGLCYGILGPLRQETSALITHRTGETVQIFRSASLFLLQIHTDSLDLPHRRPSRSDIRAERHIATHDASFAGHHQKRSSLAAWCYSHQADEQLDRFRSIGPRTFRTRLCEWDSHRLDRGLTHFTLCNVKVLRPVTLQRWG